MSDPDKPVLVYSTCPDIGTAERIGAALVEAGQAACVNILPGMRSIYRWKGAVERADEVVMIVKTRPDRAEEAMNTLARLHPYETPAILLVEVVDGARPYLDWILTETSRLPDGP